MRCGALTNRRTRTRGHGATRRRNTLFKDVCPHDCPIISPTDPSPGEGARMSEAAQQIRDGEVRSLALAAPGEAGTAWRWAHAGTF